MGGFSVFLVGSGLCRFWRNVGIRFLSNSCGVFVLNISFLFLESVRDGL